MVHPLIGEQELHVKIADFGLAKTMENVQFATTANVGTPSWMSPVCVLFASCYNVGTLSRRTI